MIQDNGTDITDILMMKMNLREIIGDKRDARTGDT